MSYKLPLNGQWTQPNLGDNQGSLWGTFNVDLTKKKGSIFGTRMISNGSLSSYSGLTNLGLATSFARIDMGDGIQYWTVAGSKVFKSVAASFPTTFIEDDLSGSPTTCSSRCSDMKVFNESLYVTTASRVVYKLGGAGWSSFTAGNVNSNSHLLAVYGNRLYMTTEVCKIISWDSADTVASSGSYTINLESAGLGSETENIITFLTPASNGIWIGTVNRYGLNARVYFWDGVTADTFENAYSINSTGAMACVIKDDVPVILNNDGVLGQLNGATFVEIARFPIRNKKMLTNAFSFYNDRWVHPNGIGIVNGRVNILVNLGEMSNNSQNEENCPSGIWEYDPDIGLYHKYSPSYYDITSSPSVTDYGQSRLCEVGEDVSAGAGAIVSIKNQSNVADKNGSVLAGFRFYTDATTAKYGIFSDDSNSTIQTYSHIITSRLPATSLQDIWNNVYAFHKPFLSSTDKIIVKYRTTDLEPVETTITWSNTTGFTTTADLSDYVIGDEVEILQGIWGGRTSHITSIQATDSGYMVEVDETYTGATGTSIARFQKWIKAGTITSTNQDSDDLGKTLIGKTRTDIQIKVCMISTGTNEIKSIGIVNKIHTQLQ
ncbi:MAG: hypothetical protein WC648_01260 [Candidatus Paceibacterota bacterium]|jgi:hypothetical protein